MHRAMLRLELGDKYSACKDLRIAAQLGKKEALYILEDVENDDYLYIH